ncbi:MAG: ABC transporter substrate-binding protein [Halopseudomonas aestusnigri]
MRLHEFKFLVLVLIFITSSVKADSVRILTENYAPFNYVEQNELKGIGAEIVTAMIAKIGKKTPNTGLFSVTRTAAREDEFYWVEPLFSVRDYIYVLREYDFEGETLEDLQKLKAIGIQAGGAVHHKMTDLKFSNLVPIHNVDKQLDFLLGNRVQALQVSDVVMSFELTKAGLEFSKVKPIAILSQADLYLAFSKTTPVEDVQIWRDALHDLIRDGDHARILKNHLPSLSIWGMESKVRIDAN